MKRLFLALLFVTPALADGTMVVRRVAPAVTADLVNESFDPSGYSTAVCGVAPCGTWTEPGTGGTTNEDQSGSCPVGTGFSSQCLDTNTGSSGSNPFSALDVGSARTGATYFSFYFAFTSAAWSAGQDQTLFTVDSVSTTPSAFTAAVFVDLLYYVDAAADPETPDCGAYPCFRLQGRIGSGTAFTTKPEITQTAIHKLRVFIQSGSATGAIYLDSTTLGSNGDSNGGGHGAWQYIRIGQVETSKAAETFYWDSLKGSSSGFVD